MRTGYRLLRTAYRLNVAQSVAACPFYVAVPTTRFKEKLSLLLLRTVGMVSPDSNEFHIFVRMR
jgi:hypothetical protein